MGVMSSTILSREGSKSPGESPGSFVVSTYCRHMSTKPPRLGVFHQAGDYVVAALLLLSLSRAEIPAWPLAIGAIGLVNAAMTRGPLAAYRRIPLPLHGAIDAMLVVACVIGAVAVRSNTTDALVLVSAAVLHGTNVWLSRAVDRAKE